MHSFLAVPVSKDSAAGRGFEQVCAGVKYGLPLVQSLKVPL